MQGASSRRFETLLVPSDLSEAAGAAASAAFRLAGLERGSVILLHVLEGMGIPSPLYAHYQASPSLEQQLELKQRARAALAALVPAGCESVPHELALRQGSAPDEICRFAGERNVSLILLTSHGRSGLKHFLLGSVAERVARHAPCSVLMLR